MSHNPATIEKKTKYPHPTPNVPRSPRFVPPRLGKIPPSSNIGGKRGLKVRNIARRLPRDGTAFFRRPPRPSTPRRGQQRRGTSRRPTFPQALYPPQGAAEAWYLAGKDLSVVLKWCRMGLENAEWGKRRCPIKVRRVHPTQEATR